MLLRLNPAKASWSSGLLMVMTWLYEPRLGSACWARPCCMSLTCGSRGKTHGLTRSLRTQGFLYTGSDQGGNVKLTP